MKLTVFGATGGVGRNLVQQALAAGHTVAAVVRDAARLGLDHPHLDVVTVTGLTDTEPLRPALDGSDAALSGVGARTRKDITVASTATRGILRALESSGVSRFVAVSAVPVGPILDGEGPLGRRVVYPLLRTVFRDIYADLALMESEIMASGTEWTIVRPPRLVSKPMTGDYRTVIGGNVPRATSVSRADVAHAMLAALDDPTTVNQAVGIG